jgi:hypothetical protein
MKTYDPIEPNNNGGGWSWAAHNMKECADGEWVKLEDVNAAIIQLQQALKQARAWGMCSDNFSAEQSRKLADWIDAGMDGAPPTIPDYYPKSKRL